MNEELGRDSGLEIQAKKSKRPIRGAVKKNLTFLADMTAMALGWGPYALIRTFVFETRNA